MPDRSPHDRLGCEASGRPARGASSGFGSASERAAPARQYASSSSASEWARSWRSTLRHSPVLAPSRPAEGRGAGRPGIGAGHRRAGLLEGGRCLRGRSRNSTSCGVGMWRPGRGAFEGGQVDAVTPPRDGRLRVGGGSGLRAAGGNRLGADTPGDRSPNEGRPLVLGPVRGLVAKVGWGDLSFADMQQIAAVLRADDVFVVLPEHPLSGRPAPAEPVTYGVRTPMLDSGVECEQLRRSTRRAAHPVGNSSRDGRGALPRLQKMARKSPIKRLSPEML